jgi:hypothetical protein
MKSLTRDLFCRTSLSSRLLHRGAAMLSISVGAATLLSACYVVPVNAPYGSGPVVHVPAPPPPPAPVSFVVRLYPANELATGYGMVSAVVTNDLNGRGTFNTNINGETFSGEATRVSNSSREGIANGAGNRGSYIACRYQMNSATLGTGQCKLSTGAQFSMHIGG